MLLLYTGSMRRASSTKPPFPGTHPKLACGLPSSVLGCSAVDESIAQEFHQSPQPVPELPLTLLPPQSAAVRCLMRACSPLRGWPGSVSGSLLLLPAWPPAAPVLTLLRLYWPPLMALMSCCLASGAGTCLTAVSAACPACEHMHGNAITRALHMIHPYNLYVCHAETTASAVFILAAEIWLMQRSPWL